MSISIGVIIPTYNRPKQTISAIESAFNQTVGPNQIVVIDDGSDEAYRQELIQLLKAYPIELVLERHCGHPGRVRNVGVNQIRTSHVAFLDSDDLWLPAKLEIQREIARSGVRAQGSGYLLSAPTSDFNLPPHNSVRQLSLEDLLNQNSLCNSSVLVETSLLRDIGGLPISYGVRGIEDYAAWLRVATITNWSFNETPLVIYSDRPESSMRSTNEFTIPENSLALLDLIGWLEMRGHKVPQHIRLARKVSDTVLKSWAAKQTLIQQ